MVGYKPLNGTTEFQEAALTLHSNNHHRHVHDWTLTYAVLDSKTHTEESLNTCKKPDYTGKWWGSILKVVGIDMLLPQSGREVLLSSPRDEEIHHNTI